MRQLKKLKMTNPASILQEPQKFYKDDGMPLGLDPIKEPTEMTLEEILEARERAGAMLEQYQAEISVYNDELMDRLKKEKVNAKVVGDKSITRVSRWSFKTPLAYAESVGATKMTLDTEKLKVLVQKGVKVPETTKSEYILVRSVKGGEDF